jgi:hypothetical protein
MYYIYIDKIFIYGSFSFRTATEYCFLFGYDWPQHEWVCMPIPFFHYTSLILIWTNVYVKKFWENFQNSLAHVFVLNLFVGGEEIFVLECMCGTVWISNSHKVDVIRMQIEVQRRLHEQLEVNTQLYKISTKYFYKCTYFGILASLTKL